MKRTIFAFIIILSVFLIACQTTQTQVSGTPTKVTKTQKTTTFEVKDPIEFIGDCKSIENEYQRDTCWIQKAALSKDTTICKTKVSDKWVNGCIGDVAINSRNPELCKLTIQPVDERSLTSCTQSYAINTLNPDYCKTDQCKTTVSEWLKKYSLHFSDCKEMNDKVKNSAFSGANEHTIQQQCYEFLAYLELEPDYCKDISFKKTKDQCINKAKKSDYTFEKCSTRMGYSHYRDVCFYQLSQQEDSNKYCKYILLDALKNRCLNS
jgi:hypothetical protein